MSKFILSYKSYSFLMESMDSPWEYKEAPDLKLRNPEGKEVGYFEKDDTEHGMTNRKLYNLGKNGWMTTYERAGATEIHHYNSALDSLSIFNKAPPNPRFISTMFHHAKNLIDNEGKTIRVVGKLGDSLNKYHRIASILAVRHEYIASPIQQSTFNSLKAKEFGEFTIKQNNNDLVQRIDVHKIMEQNVNRYEQPVL